MSSHQESRPAQAAIRVLLWGTYDTSKPRTRILREGLRASGASLDECHAPVWERIEDKSQVSGYGPRLWLLFRWLFSYPALLWRFLRVPRPDLVLVGYPGLLDVIALAPLARLRRVPLAWDMFMSLYDTVVLDRQLIDAGTPSARALRWIEGKALAIVDLVFLDTDAHARRVESLYGLPSSHCGAVWVGAEVERFRVSPPMSPRRPGAALRVLFYGQFIPLHGIDTIVSAARLLSEEAVEWTLVGRGQEASKIRQMLDATPLPKLRWVKWVSYADLKDWIAEADIALGIFGTSAKAESVIPNKVFQIIAAGRPLITRDSPAIRELLDPATPCVRLVRPGDPQALADAVRDLEHEASSPHPAPCHGALAERITALSIGRQFQDLVARRLQLPVPVPLGVLPPGENPHPRGTPREPGKQ